MSFSDSQRHVAFRTRNFNHLVMKLVLMAYGYVPLLLLVSSQQVVVCKSELAILESLGMESVLCVWDVRTP
eukprot:6479094-Amphidinium_carterae.1